MIKPLFMPDIHAPDLAYKHIRDDENEPANAARELVESLWQRYAPYADSNFRTQIQTAFDERFWEMYLTCSAPVKSGLPREFVEPFGPYIEENRGYAPVFLLDIPPRGAKIRHHYGVSFMVS